MSLGDLRARVTGEVAKVAVGQDDGVEALASALARTDRPGEAAEPVRRHARSLALRRAHGQDLAQAAQKLGLDPDEVRALDAPELADDDVLAAGSALSKLTGTRG